MQKVPECIGIIVDGNRRWAKERGLPKLEGHRAGYNRLKEFLRWSQARGVKHVAAYVFSTENWNRPKEEVDYLMQLFIDMAERSFAELAEENMRLRFIGKLEMLPDALQKAIARLEKISAEKTGLTTWICISYGGRAEIIDAAQSLAKNGSEITEESLRTSMWSAEMPDPDIIIRTGAVGESGAMRISNFLIWQAAYSEFFFLKEFFPDMSEAILDRVLEEFGNRERRLGR